MATSAKARSKPISVRAKPPGQVWALIPAAGTGTRMRSAPAPASAPARPNARARQPLTQPHKALLELNGVPLIRRSLERLFEIETLTGVVVATHVDDLPAMADLLAPLKRAGAPKLFIVPGGATRQASCHAALTKAEQETSTIDQRTARVFFHDAARPLITAAEVRALLAALETAAVALLATPITQTIKRATPDGTVEATVPRERMYLAQTPQGFRFADALHAFRYAEEAGFEATDDVALAEFAGLPVKIVPGSPWNIKITTPEDLELAQAILKLQGRA